ncbi:CDP-glycerol glycerophosphotransferase family protein [Anaeromicropila populeti]|uniref:CDP-glycerol glycerophosphotransferase n=1 Tax=Anaeromicropila populeti TaxID=37658 RepID=A0A1I6HRJ7_9FIRM|nr:CDP-glycerol glycerophosphotransferase family protein [Anaeromicropila populeti]SFR56890.1 CDP-glycerol glycerophosphotransferase [Anaeromicropila populeti]
MKLRSVIKKCKVIAFNSYYAHYYYKNELKENIILVESKNGGDLAGNMFHILKELTSGGYQEYKIVLSCTKKKHAEIKERLDKYEIKNLEFVNTNTYAYYKMLATAKYLFTDTTFTRTYLKKEGQIITNTWHGTPLKFMGRDVEDRAYAMGNVQRNLLYADYLIYPNEYMKEKMVTAYHLDMAYEGTILNEGYPRNSVFFDKAAGSSIRTELNIEDKQVYIYMPTWRGTLTNKNTDHLLAVMEYLLLMLDQQLSDNQCVYVKLHPFISKGMDFSKFTHIQDYPAQYDVYEFMNMCDGLITDYSSVFYDFANTGKKIILWAYDESDYLGERGVYTTLKEMPFPVVKKVEDLVTEINTPKNYDDTLFRNECCTYDGPGAAERICKHVIRGEKVCKEEKLNHGNKEKVLMYGSALAQNGLTTSLLNLFENIDLTKRNYFVSFTETAVKKQPLRVSRIPENVGIMPMSSEASFTIFEAAAYILFFKRNKENKFTKKYLDRLYKRELIKHFGGVKFDYFIQFAGYEKKIINLFERFDGPRFIYVHNDMVAEMKARGNQHYLTLRNAYQNYDKVAVVTRDIVPPTLEISNKKDNIVIVNNCHAHMEIRRRGDLPVEFDDDTICNVSFEELQSVLKSKNKKFISIGRFSAEKGHMMLMQAFERFNKDYKDSVLIIIGGHGNLWRQTFRYASESKAQIITIRSMKNPMSILKKCDLFILSSVYEGLGLTMLEADALGIPSMSTDIPGPQGFMQDYGGYLVEPSEDGLVKGMKAFMKGKVKAMNVDYDQYNQRAVEQFESLFERLGKR